MMQDVFTPFFFFFFFQAEDGIRFLTVTGVQTCALPISLGKVPHEPLPRALGEGAVAEAPLTEADLQERVDRKSTRLNSSHSQISYAVFCLKKKKNNNSTSYTLLMSATRRRC